MASAGGAPAATAPVRRRSSRETTEVDYSELTETTADMLAEMRQRLNSAAVDIVCEAGKEAGGGWKRRVFERNNLDPRQHGNQVRGRINKLSAGEKELIRAASKQLLIDAEAESKAAAEAEPSTMPRPSKIKKWSSRSARVVIFSIVCAQETKQP